MTAIRSEAAPFSMLTIGLILILVATLTVVQSQSVTVSPVQADLNSLFEVKTGQLTLEAPPYCGPIGIFCFVVNLLRLIFNRILAVFGGLGASFGGSFSGTVPGGPLSAGAGAGVALAPPATTFSATADASTCASGRDGRQCRRDARQAAREARRAARALR